MSMKPVAWRCRPKPDCVWGMTTDQHTADVLSAHGDEVQPLYALPDTHRIVPVEPTIDVLQAGAVALCNTEDSSTWQDDMRAVYAAMLAAAPDAGESHGNGMVMLEGGS